MGERRFVWNLGISLWEYQKVVPQGPFGQTKLYFELEKRPAGAFWAKYFISCESKVACIFLKNKSQKALNHVLMGWSDRSRCADLLVILLLKKVLSASSYGHLAAAKEFWSQCHIFRFGNKNNFEKEH